MVSAEEDEVVERSAPQGSDETLDVMARVRRAKGDRQPMDSYDLVQPAIELAAAPPLPAILLNHHRSPELPEDAVVVVDAKA